MLTEVPLGHKSLADYTHIAGRGLIEQIRDLVEPLQGRSVLHVSATAFGGGVSEILYTLVPLMRDVGLDAHWQVILGREDFFNVTKLMHNSLQGDPQALNSPTMVKVFELLRRSQKYFDDGIQGRAWNLAAAMVIEGKAGILFMGDWAKGERGIACQPDRVVGGLRPAVAYDDLLRRGHVLHDLLGQPVLGLGDPDTEQHRVFHRPADPLDDGRGAVADARHGDAGGEVDQ